MVITIIYGILLFLVVLPLLYWMYFKLKNPFWGSQPVNHNHHFYRNYMSPFIIKPDFYNQKFMNPLQVKTIAWSENEKKEEFQNFIQEHFCNQNKFKYLPVYDTHIEPYFRDDKNAYMSTYQIAGIVTGTITNRSVHVHLPKNNSFLVSYIDYLCVHSAERKRNIAPELIQTHEYFQRTKSNKKCMVSLFKKEGKLHGFTPLVQYKTYVCNPRVQTLIQRIKLPTHLRPTWFSLSTFKNILPHAFEIQKTKPAFLIPPLECLNNLVERKSIQVCGILDMNTQQFVASFWFRDTAFYCESDKPNVECFASLRDNKKIDVSSFRSGFLEALIKISEHYNYLHLEGLGDNLFLSSMPWIKEYETPCAYYLYNYSHKTMNAHDITVLI